MVCNAPAFRYRAVGEQFAQSLGKLAHVALVDLLPTLYCSLTGSLAGRRIGEALSLRLLESRLFNQDSFTLVPFSRPTEPNDYRTERRVLGSASGQSRITAGEKNEVIEIGACEAEGPFPFHSEKAPLRELASAFRTGRITNDPEDDDVAGISTNLTAALSTCS